MGLDHGSRYSRGHGSGKAANADGIRCLPPAAMAALQESGFVVLTGPYSVERLGVVADAYDAEVGAAVGDDIRIGSSRVAVYEMSSLVARGESGCPRCCTDATRFLVT